MKENFRLAASIFWLLLGAALVLLSLMEKIDSVKWSGMGVALIVVGALQLVKKYRMRKNPEYRERMAIEESDERSRFIRMKAWSWAGYLYLLGMAFIGIVTFALGNEAYSQFFMGGVCVLLFLYLAAYMLLNRKY